jgi:hypothetical protein
MVYQKRTKKKVLRKWGAENTQLRQMIFYVQNENNFMFRKTMLKSNSYPPCNKDCTKVHMTVNRKLGIIFPADTGTRKQFY